MADPEKPTLSYLDSPPITSSCISNGDNLLTEFSPPEISSFRKLSENLHTLFRSPKFELYSDLKIATEGGQEVSVHRCILAARSPFLKQVLTGSGKDRYELKELAKDFHAGYDALVSVLDYMYSGKVKSPPPEIISCIDEDCPHESCRPVTDFAVEAFYVSYAFQIADLVDVWKIRLFEMLDKISKDDTLAVLSVANLCDKENGILLNKCIDGIVRSNIDIVTLEKALPENVVKLITDTRKKSGMAASLTNAPPNKHVRRIHRAIDSDDIELIRLLLKEGHTTLDDACALHYAVAYCDAKTTTELLDIGLADVNHRNPRGYTVLHVAAMRKEPKIILSLLTKGARPSDLTPDGRKALQISKRLTKSGHYYKTTEQGNASPKERLCIDVLEQAERRDPLIGEASASLAKAGEDLRSRLLYLENRVSLARLLFPAEAKVAMDIAHVDGTPEFSLAKVDLNDSPFVIKEEHLSRLKALSKTVELGKHFFPRCSEVLNKIMDDDDLGELACLATGTTEEQVRKRERYLELQELLSKAFSEDQKEQNRSISSSSSSTTTEGHGRSKVSRRQPQIIV